jgi:hypothetical protein
MVVHDSLLTHPKVMKAGARLGARGSSTIIHLHLWGIAYARQHLTDGFIPLKAVASCGAISKCSLVAEAMCARGVRLWRKVKGGYQIHDFHEYNPTAAAERVRRERSRKYMAQYRKAKAE